MKKLMFLICVLFVSVPALAYEPQVFNKDSRIYSYYTQNIADRIWYSNDQLNRIQTVAAKRNLAGCVMDHMAAESLEYFEPNSNAHDEYLLSAAGDIRTYMTMNSMQRDLQLDPKIHEWVLNFEYQCLDYHPDPNYVLNQIAYLEANEEFEKTCDQNDQDCYIRILNKYKEAMGVQ